MSIGEDTNILSFDDALTVRGYAIPAMQWACGSGLVTSIAQNSGMLLAPKDTTTRVQAATLMMRALLREMEKLQAALKQAIEMPVATLDERYAAYNALKQAVEECASVVGISKDIAGLLEECSIYKENSTADQETVNAFEIAIKTAEGYVHPSRVYG